MQAMHIAAKNSYERDRHADDDDSTVPLIVDLDGTLLKSDLLYETFFDALATHGWNIVDGRLFKKPSKQGLKAHLATLSKINYAELPYNQAVLELILSARQKGRKVYLATASHHMHAKGVADSLGLFEGIFASDDAVNLKGERKAEALIAAFGRKGFDYVGNDGSDLAIWQHARKAFSVGLSGHITKKLLTFHPQQQSLENKGFDFRALFKALRPHQYAKNALIFVPLLTAHQFNITAVSMACLAFIAFCLCASGVYLLNDLLDIQADRGHPVKKNRPFAAGRLPISVGILLVPVLTALAFAIAWLVSPAFFVTLAVYYAITNAYSFSLKKRMLVDVVCLALLYTIRVFAGAAAIDVVISEWLFTFSLLIFTALALTKRYIELTTRLDGGLADPSNRNYKITDVPVIAALAAAAGMNSIMVLALYVSSDEVAGMYSRPHILWGLCPLFLYWITRTLMLAHRRLMDDDPITFALKDDRSWAIGIMSILLVFFAL